MASSWVVVASFWSWWDALRNFAATQQAEKEERRGSREKKRRSSTLVAGLKGGNHGHSWPGFSECDAVMVRTEKSERRGLRERDPWTSFQTSRK